MDMQKEHEQVLSDLNIHLADCRWELTKKSEKVQEVGLAVTSA